MRRLLLVLLLATVVAVPSLADAVTVNLPATKDNTLYNNTAFPTSNALGSHFFAGQSISASFSLRRGLIAFDIAGSIPGGATITGATLTLNMSRTLDPSGRTVALHRLTSDWGEGTSDALGNEGGGTSATPGDATWLHTFFSGSFWTTQGGDFVGVPSATQSVGGLGLYSWTGAGVVADVQFWLDNPAVDYGWLLFGDESTAPTAKRFDSRDNLNPAVRPVLVVDYELPIPARATTWGAVKALMSDD